MEFKFLLLFLIVAAFAMNMGASGLAPSFAALFGAKLVNHKKAVAWFGLFVFLGAVLAGHNVVKTLGGKIIPSQFLSYEVTLIILLAALIGLAIANFLKVPQSTSWSTVFAIFGAGLALGKVEISILWHLLPFWLILPALSFVLTYFIYGLIYPPRFNNLWLYQAIFNKGDKMRLVAFCSCCYVAFAIGSNNVANAVGPLSGGGLISPFWGLILVAPLFGLGGLIFGQGIMDTVGKEIVPLGLISASLIGFVTASLLLCASLAGIPQSLVQLSALSVMAIGAVKHERHIFNESASRKIFLTWLITPLIAFVLGFALTKLFIV